MIARDTSNVQNLLASYRMEAKSSFIHTPDLVCSLG